MRKTVTVFGSLIAMAAMLAASDARAIALDAAACEALAKEKSALEAAGTQADMHLKLEEAKALGDDRLKRIQHYIEISGDVLFRCSSIALATNESAKAPGDAKAANSTVAKASAGTPAKRKIIRTRRHKH